jgi:hypothetical protein
VEEEHNVSNPGLLPEDVEIGRIPPDFNEAGWPS